MEVVADITVMEPECWGLTKSERYCRRGTFVLWSVQELERITSSPEGASSIVRETQTRELLRFLAQQ